MRKSGLSSVQLMLTLFVCGLSVVLLHNFDKASADSFTFYIPCIISALLLSILYCIPSLMINRRTGLGFPSLAHRATPSAIVFVAAFYSVFFVYAAQYFLLKYADVFESVLNPETNIYVVAAVLIAVCAYSGGKGINTVTGCGIFIFAFSILALGLVFCGNISDLNFQNSSFEFSAGAGDFASLTAEFAAASFLSVLFAFTCGYYKRAGIKRVAVTLGILSAVFALSVFFTCFVLGEYGKKQPYRMSTLSKSAHFGSLQGLDSFFLSSVTLSVFLILSLIFVCIGIITGKSGKTGITPVFGVISYILFLCAEQFNSVKEILTSPYIFNTLIFIAAVIIPGVYAIFFWRRSYA